MKFNFWKKLTDEQKEQLLRKISIGAAIVFVVILLLLLMKCEGCSAKKNRKRDFSDGRGHSYGEEFSGADIFNNAYGEGAEDYTIYNSINNDDDEERKRLEEEARLKAEKEAAEKAEAERIALEEKKRKEEAAAQKKLEDEKAKKSAEEKARKEEAKKVADEKARKAEAKRLADEEKKRKLEEENARKKAEEEEKKRAEEAKKLSAEKNNTKLEELAKRLTETSSDSEKQKLLDEGVALAKKMIETGSETDAAHYILAQDAQKKKDYLRSLSELEKAIALNESNYLYYYDMGKLQYLLRRYNDAKKSFIRSVELNDHFSPSVYNLGLTYVKLDDENSALTSFKKSVSINPEYEKGYIEQARVYNRQGKLAECVKAYDNMIKRFPDNNSAVMELGSVYYQYGKYEESEAQYKKVIEKLSKSEEKTLTAYNLSKVLYDDQKYEEAAHYGWIAYDEKDFLINDIQQANITYNYALIQEKNGKTSDAKRLYNETLKLNPAHTKSKINLSVIYMSNGKEEVDKALTLLLEAYKTDSKDFSVNNNLGTVYMLKEDYASAEKYYKAALTIYEDDEDALLNLANAQVKGGKLSDATINFQKITSKNPENLEAFVGLAKVLIQTGDGDGAYKNLIYVKNKNANFRKAEVDSLIAVLRD